MDFSVFSDEHYMKLAYQQALKARELGEIPVGAIIVCGQTIVAKAHNQTETLNDATAHAEMLAITAAANYLGAKYLTECTLFVTLEPCLMCAGAIFWSQLQRLVYGAADPSKGYCSYSKSKSVEHTEGSKGKRVEHTEGSKGKSVEHTEDSKSKSEEQAGHTEGCKSNRLEHTGNGPGGYGLLHPKTEVVSGLLAEQCGCIVEDFFRELRN